MEHTVSGSIGLSATLQAEPQHLIAYTSLLTGDGTGYVATQTTWQAQTFSHSEAFRLYAVQLYAYKSGTVNSVTVSIQAVDGNGKPTGSDLLSTTVDATNFPTAKAWISFVFNDSIVCEANTKYAIVARVTSGSGSFYCRAVTVTTAYAGGAIVQSSNSGSTWTVGTRDLLFVANGTPPSIDVAGSIGVSIESQANTAITTLVGGTISGQAELSATPALTHQVESSINATVVCESLPQLIQSVDGSAYAQLTCQADCTRVNDIDGLVVSTIESEASINLVASDSCELALSTMLKSDPLYPATLWSIGSDSSSYSYAISNTTWEGQKFTPTQPVILTGVTFYLSASYAVSDTFTVEIYNVDLSTGLPTGSPIGSGTFTLVNQTYSGAKYVSLTNSVLLTANTTYAAVIRRDLSTPAVYVRGYSTLSGHVRYSSGSWQTSTGHVRCSLQGVYTNHIDLQTDVSADLFQWTRYDYLGGTNCSYALTTGYVAQTVTPSVNYDLHRIVLRGYSAVQDTSIQVSIRAVGGDGKPTGPDLISTTDVTQPPTSAAYLVAKFATPFECITGVPYAIIIKRASGTGTVNISMFSYGGYAGGQIYYSSSGDTWTANAGDFLFYCLGVTSALKEVSGDVSTQLLCEAGGNYTTNVYGQVVSDADIGAYAGVSYVCECSADMLVDMVGQLELYGVHVDVSGDGNITVSISALADRITTISGVVETLIQLTSDIVVTTTTDIGGELTVEVSIGGSAVKPFKPYSAASTIYLVIAANSKLYVSEV